MGCDIHMYVEYNDKKREDAYWRSFGGRINPGRNYWIFGLISKGVRAEFEESMEDKGLPDELGSYARSDSHLYITDAETDEEGCCSLKRAKEWEANGHKITYKEGKPIWVAHPDWHSHTWLTVEEYRKVIEIYLEKNQKGDYNDPEPAYQALLSAMEKLAEFDNDVRVVIWFDN